MVTFQRLTAFLFAALAFPAFGQNNDCPAQPWEYQVSTGDVDRPWHGSRQAAADWAGADCAAKWNSGVGCLGIAGNTTRLHVFITATLNSSDPGAATGNWTRHSVSTGANIGDINHTIGLWRRSTVTCPPPPGCDDSYVNTKIASFYPVGQNPPPQVCDTNSGCTAELQERSGHCGPGECGFYYKIYGDFDCESGDPDLEPGSIAPAPQETCQTIGNAEYCIGSAPDANNANCGYLNDQWVCVNATPKGGCQDAAGGVLCDAAAGTPPGPDSGTAGTPATPDGQVKAETGPAGTVNNYNYFNSATVGASSRPPATGSPTGGTSGDSNGSGFTGDGDTEGEEGGTGSASGGESCASAPVCEGDPIQCAILAQQWRTRCAEASTAAQIQAQAGLSSGEVDGTALNSLLPVVEFGSLSEAGPLGGASCPPPISFSVKGQSISLDVWRGACDLAGLVAPLLMALSYLGAALLIYRGVIA